MWTKFCVNILKYKMLFCNKFSFLLWLPDSKTQTQIFGFIVNRLFSKIKLFF